MELKQLEAKNKEMKTHMSRVLQENEALRVRVGIFLVRVCYKNLVFLVFMKFA